MREPYPLNEDINEHDIEQIIRVQRVQDTNSQYYLQDEISDNTAEETADFPEQDFEPQSPSWRTEPALDRNEFDSLEESDPIELPEHREVVTLYYSEHETTPEHEVTENVQRPIRFRLTPASSIFRTQSRDRSAPPAHLTDFQEFKGSEEYLQIESAYSHSEDLIYNNLDKLDLDSAEGYTACKKLLDSIEVIMKSLHIPLRDRSYRRRFSQAYKVLYRDNGLCYLPEILNAAQERNAYIIVNSEKYIFSPNVLRAADKLLGSFDCLKYLIKDIFSL
jgi:hypothetical protein